MKKLLLVLAIGAFVACNDSGSTDAPAGGDTSTNAAPAPDTNTTVAPDTTLKSDTTTADTSLKK